MWIRFSILFLLGQLLIAQQPDPLLSKTPQLQQKWVDSVFNTLSVDQKIGQLFTPMVFSIKDTAHYHEIKTLIEKYHIGGIIFSQGGPVKQTQWLNAFQSMSKVPLLISMDAEWGVAMRLDSVVAFPWNMTLGATRDNAVIEKIGTRMAEQEFELGVHMSYVPVLDINTNPKNPIIGNRSFGENPQRVAEKGIALMRGHHKAGILTSGKHFPGHGNTSNDSHKTLPTIGFDQARLDTTELYPFKKVIEQGLSSVMTAHLNVPALTQSIVPTSLSHEVVTLLLKDKIGFNGLAITDALNMKGAQTVGSKGNTDLTALMAGNDILLISDDIPSGFEDIKVAYRETPQVKERVEESVKKILKAKFIVGISKIQQIDTRDLYRRLNTRKDSLLIEEAFAKSITLLKNSDAFIPLNAGTRYAHIKLGDAGASNFELHLKSDIEIESIAVGTVSKTLNSLKPFKKVIISYHRSNRSPFSPQSFLPEEIELIQSIAKKHQVLLDVFVNPYPLIALEDLASLSALVVSYQNSPISQEISAKLLKGQGSFRGVLPVGISAVYPEGGGIFTKPIEENLRIRQIELGFDPDKLAQIDLFAQQVIDSAMAPGMQVLVARKGSVLYQKSFGHHTYEKKIKVENHHLYDLASLTKITATLPLIIREVDRGSFSLDSPLVDLMPDLKGSNKANLEVKEVLTHYAKLVPWIPFYRATLNNDGDKQKKFYRGKRRNRFDITVADQVYLRSNYPPKMRKEIIESPLLDSLYYRYSDIPFYLFKDFLEDKYKSDLSKLAERFLFAPLGLKRTVFNPWKFYPMQEIVPSEIDDYFRNQELRGYVHDMGAAMLGGVGGHAGLFSNAEEVFKIMQMYLQKGSANGHEFFGSNTFNLFNDCLYCDQGNRRGVGFDKPQLEGEGPTCGCVSEKSFGHMGFTGTYAWVDPEQELIFVFLSNRTYPSLKNNLLGEKNIRTRMQALVHKALIH